MTAEPALSAPGLRTSLCTATGHVVVLERPAHPVSIHRLPVPAVAVGTVAPGSICGTGGWRL